tara:strand:+ start:117991 stop:118098 length:108 start_codon:yes stop_codon:yes gene_type:complete
LVSFPPRQRRRPHPVFSHGGTGGPPYGAASQCDRL